MSAVIDEVKRKNRFDYRASDEACELLMNTGKSFKESLDYAVVSTYGHGINQSDAERITYELTDKLIEAENKVLAAESRTEAKNSQISMYANMLKEKDRAITQLKTQLKKATIPQKNIYMLCAWVLAIGLVSGIGISVLIFSLFPN